MLEQVLAHLRNWFFVCAYSGTYTIDESKIELPFLKEGQYFRITGSLFNDGVYCYDGDHVLMDETFNGIVWALAVPPALIELVRKIEEWQEKNAEAARSPFASESFGGYSYTKATNANGQIATSWQSAFRTELNRWRKI